MKYIILKVELPTSTIELPLIFSRNFIHAVAASQAITDLNEEGLYEVEVVSGGFLSILTSTCYGESTTLNTKSRPQDTAIIRKIL